MSLIQSHRSIRLPNFKSVCSQCRALSHFRTIEHVVPASHIRTYPGATQPQSRDKLKLAVKQYIPLKNSFDVDSTCEPVTIIGAHANGFPKEMYEPLWDDLYEQLRSRRKRIANIWIADFANQGQSGMMNHAILGDDPNWWDHVRDLLFLVNQKQSHMTQPMIGIGHSMGASILAGLSMLHPSLFQSLVLIEPVIQIENPSKHFAPASTYRRDRWPSRQAAVDAFAKSKFYQQWDERVLRQWLDHGLRRETDDKPLVNSGHPTLSQEISVSREAALHDDRQEPTTLDPGDNDDNDAGPVTLTTTKAQEVFHYLRPLYKTQLKTSSTTTPELHQYIYPDINTSDIEAGYEFYRPEAAELYRRLPELRPSTLYIFGESSALSTPALRQQKLETTGTGVGGSGGTEKGRVVAQVVLDRGHIVPFEIPAVCAGHVAKWVDGEVDRWQSVSDEWLRLWNKDTTSGGSGSSTSSSSTTTTTTTKKITHQDIDEEWLKRMPKPERLAKASKT